MHRPASRLLAALLTLLVIGPVFARETDAEWRQHKAEFQQAMNSDSAAEKERAVRGLARADREEAVDLLLKILDWQDPRIRSLLSEREKIQKGIDTIFAAAKNQGGSVSQGEYDRFQRLQAELQAVNEKIAVGSFMNNAAVVALASMRDPEAIDRMIDKGLGDRSWRVRAGVCQALGMMKEEKATERLIDAIGDRDSMVKTAAIDALAGMGKTEAVDAIIKELSDKEWQVRVSAARALGRLGDARGIGPLVEQMQKEEGRTLEDFDAALKDLTGHTTHGHAGAWQGWYNANKSRLAEVVATKDESSEGDAEVGKTVTFYGISTKSKRIIFIIDFSGSMTEPAGSVPQSATTGGAGGGPGGQLPANPTKLDVAKFELKNAVGGLPDDAKFNIVYYNQRVELLKPNGMLTSNRGTKQQTYRWIDGLEADGLTNIYDAIVQAFELVGRGAVDANYKVGVDTIFFLTDGYPTAGTIQEPNKILEDIKQRNSLRKIKIHVIGVGGGAAAGQPGQPAGGGLNTDFLKKLAEDNDGQYVQR